MGDMRSKEVLAELAKGCPLSVEERRSPALLAARPGLETEIGAELDDVFARVAADPVAEFP
jgi:hypothetical protein